MSNILITGHEGFVGNALVGKLKKEGNLIVGIDKGRCSNMEILNTPDFSFKGDMRDFKLLRKIIVDYEIEEIYHFAGLAITKICSTNPYNTLSVNVMGTATLLEVCRNWGANVRKIIISTSDKAFGNSPIPYTEESPLRPLYAYDTSKSCQQLVALSYFNNYNVPVRIVACANIYGEGDFNMSRIIPATITRLMQGTPARLWEDSANHIREFIHIDDVLDAFITVADKGNNGEVYCCYIPFLTRMVKWCKSPRGIGEVLGKNKLLKCVCCGATLNDEEHITLGSCNKKCVSYVEKLRSDLDSKFYSINTCSRGNHFCKGREKHCGSCALAVGKKKKCMICKKVYYCNKKCQQNDLERHRKICKK